MKKQENGTNCVWFKLNAIKLLEFCKKVESYKRPRLKSKIDFTVTNIWWQESYIYAKVVSEYFGEGEIEEYLPYIFNGEIVYRFWEKYDLGECEDECEDFDGFEYYDFLLSPNSKLTDVFKRYYESGVFDEESKDFIDSIEIYKKVSGDKMEVF
jgi:hypothetical protein